MGIIVDVTIAPRDGRHLSPAAFIALALDIARGGVGSSSARDAEPGEPGSSTAWVLPPFVLRTGELAHRAIWDGKPNLGLPSLVSLDDSALVAAVEHDVCVWFASLEHDNEEMCGFGTGPHGGECRAGLFRVRTPVTLVETNAYVDDDELAALALESVEATCWFAVTGKHAPDAEELVNTPLGRRLREAFGELHLTTSLS